MELNMCGLWVGEGGKNHWPLHLDVSYFWWLGSNGI